MSYKNNLEKIKSVIKEIYPDNSEFELNLSSGFINLYCSAPHNIKLFMGEVIKGCIKEAKTMNKASMDNIKAQIDAIKSGKKPIVN